MEAIARYGQVVLGPPGAGKTTYCHALQLYFKAVGRPHCLINLDPANEQAPFEWDIDIKDLIQLEDVMDEMKLGPNGGLLFCMDFLLENLEWLKSRI